MASKKLLSISDKTSTPPNGWHVAMPEDGAIIQSGTFHALYGAVASYRSENQLEPWNVTLFEDTLCRQLPPNSNNCGLEAVNPRDFADLELLIKLNAEDAPKSVWGPRGWQILHQHKLTDEESDGDWLRAFTSLLICLNCRHHFQQMQALNPPPLTDQSAFFNWSVAVHNEVNKTRGALTLTEEEARRKWVESLE